MVQFGIHKLVHVPRQIEALDDTVLFSKIEHIQRVIMGQNFDIHLELNSYSDMVEDQRRILYAERLKILKGDIPMSPSEQRIRLFISMSSGRNIWHMFLTFAKASTWRA